jgi:hypothetical protein
MGVAFVRNQVLTPNDLDIKIVNQSVVPPQFVDPYTITYTIYDKTSGIPVVYGAENNPAVSAGVGRYYVNWTIPSTASLGDWEVQFHITDVMNGPERCAAIEFAIVENISTVTGFLANLDSRNQSMIAKLRVLLRDNNPDKYYHFRPPNTSSVVMGFTEKIGYIWSDEELFCFIVMSLDAINAWPTRTYWTIPDISIEQHLPQRDLPRAWESAVLYHAAELASRAVSAMWIADEFQYSISGVSLSLEKSQKYEALANAFGTSATKFIEMAKKTMKLGRGMKTATTGSVAGFFRTGQIMNVGSIVGNVRL